MHVFSVKGEGLHLTNYY